MKWAQIRTNFVWLTALCVVVLAESICIQAAEPVGKSASRPNVLFIVVDDMNDWITLLDSEAPIQTPNLEALAKQGMLFTRAYCASPACNPSRAATLTGLRPSTTGVYGNSSDWRFAVGDRPTLMQRFRRAGYDVRGAGKIFHHQLEGAFHDDASFDQFQPMAKQVYPAEKLNGAPDYGSANTDWGVWPEKVEDSIDFQTTEYCINAIQEFANRKGEAANQPFFLACGIYKPHSPFFAPQTYHDQYAAVDLKLTTRQADDLTDLPSGAQKLMQAKKWFWSGMMKVDRQHPGSYDDFLHAYAACASFADAQIGRVIDALHKSGQADNTIVVLWSDHGFHLGEKDHIEKFALWEKTTHIPFIVVAPGVTQPGSRCGRPVDMSAVYPTLLELCDLPADATADGVSLLPLLKNAKADWERPAVMTYLRGNHAVRSERYRYIRYADGSEELYDHQSDPHEWNNLLAEAKDRSQYAEVITELAKWLPKANAAQVRDLKRNRSPSKGVEP